MCEYDSSKSLCVSICQCLTSLSSTSLYLSVSLFYTLSIPSLSLSVTQSLHSFGLYLSIPLSLDRLL